MAWRDNELVVQELATQGFANEDTKVLSKPALTQRLHEIFALSPVLDTGDDYLTKLAEVRNVGISSDDLIEMVLPGFIEEVDLDDDEYKLYVADPDDHPDLALRLEALQEARGLLWGTYSKTGSNGFVQKSLVVDQLLLIDVDVERDGNKTKVKVATSDQHLIIEHYVRPRGDKLVKVSSTLRDDCLMVGSTFPAITGRMRAELGAQIDTAVDQLRVVADSSFAKAVGTGSAGKGDKPSLLAAAAS